MALLQGFFAKETYNDEETPTNRSHSIAALAMYLLEWDG